MSKKKLLTNKATRWTYPAQPIEGPCPSPCLTHPHPNLAQAHCRSPQGWGTARACGWVRRPAPPRPTTQPAFWTTAQGPHSPCSCPCPFPPACPCPAHHPVPGLVPGLALGPGLVPSPDLVPSPYPDLFDPRALPSLFLYPLPSPSRHPSLFLCLPPSPSLRPCLLSCPCPSPSAPAPPPSPFPLWLPPLAAATAATPSSQTAPQALMPALSHAHHLVSVAQAIALHIAQSAGWKGEDRTRASSVRYLLGLCCTSQSLVARTPAHSA